MHLNRFAIAGINGVNVYVCFEHFVNIICWVRIVQRVGYEISRMWVRNVEAWVRIVWVRKIHGYETTEYRIASQNETNKLIY